VPNSVLEYYPSGHYSIFDINHSVVFFVFLSEYSGAHCMMKLMC
jgi:hypothetical protein